MTRPEQDLAAAEGYAERQRRDTGEVDAPTIRRIATLLINLELKGTK